MLLPIKQLQTTTDKKGLVELARKTVLDMLDEGNTDPLKVIIELRRIQVFAEEASHQLAESAFNEALKHGAKTFDLHGAEVNICDLGVRFDYTGDPVWTRLNMASATAELKRKEREALLKSIREPMTVVDEDTGEVIEIRPALRTSKEGLKIIL